MVFESLKEISEKIHKILLNCVWSFDVEKNLIFFQVIHLLSGLPKNSMS